MNTTQKILFAVFLAAATSTSFAAPHTHLNADIEVSNANKVEAEYPANQTLLEQLNLRQQNLIERLEAENQIEFNQRVDLERLHQPDETHSTTK